MKVLCVLYDDPVDGYPNSYARDTLPEIEQYPGGQTLPTPKAIDFSPGQLLGSVSGELGLREFLEGAGHTLVVTSDKDGPDSVFERELPDADVVISQPFWPAYLTAERIAKARRPEAGHHRRHRLRPRRPAGGHRPRRHGRRGHLLQQHQRRRARRDDDPGAGAQLHPVLRVGDQGRLEHRRLRAALLRPGGHDTSARSAPAASAWPCCAGSSPSTCGCTTPTAPPAGGGRTGARPHLPPGRRATWCRCATW